jgi:serine/threonine protein kinase
MIPDKLHESSYLFIRHPQSSSTGQLFLRNAEGTVISLHAEVYSSRSKLKDAQSSKTESIGLEIVGKSGREFLHINSIEAKKKMGDEFSAIKHIAKDVGISKSLDTLPEVDQQLKKVFSKALESGKTVEISAQPHTYTVIKGDILLHVNDKFAEGGIKSIKLAQNILNDEFIVIAHIKDSASKADLKKGIVNLENEYLMHKKFQGIGFMKVHDFIVYRNVTTNAQHAILSAFYPTDIKKVIDKQQNMPKNTQIRAMFEASLALAKMHQDNYVHLDLKPENIYLKWAPDHPDAIEVGLGDFGEARELTPKNLKKMDEWGGTPHYHPPERYAKVYRVFAQNPELCEKTFQMNLESLVKAGDVYAQGKTFLELATGKFLTNEEGLAFAKGEMPEDPILALAWKMMRPEPKERLTMHEVLEVFSSF